MQGSWFIVHKDHLPGPTSGMGWVLMGSQRRTVQQPLVPDQGPAAVKNERGHLEQQHPAAETPTRQAAGQHTESPREVPPTPWCKEHTERKHSLYGGASTLPAALPALARGHLGLGCMGHNLIVAGQQMNQLRIYAAP